MTSILREKWDTSAATQRTTQANGESLMNFVSFCLHRRKGAWNSIPLEGVAVNCLLYLERQYVTRLKWFSRKPALQFFSQIRWLAALLINIQRGRSKGGIITMLPARSRCPSCMKCSYCSISRIVHIRDPFHQSVTGVNYNYGTVIIWCLAMMRVYYLLNWFTNGPLVDIIKNVFFFVFQQEELDRPPDPAFSTRTHNHRWVKN